MEFLPGAFEREWERRRAVLLHELQVGQPTMIDWDQPQRGGVARLPDERWAGLGHIRGPRVAWGRRRLTPSTAGRADRAMRARFAALARGSQPAVVKLASYGGGARAAAMISYASRGGELAVENERGERVLGKGALEGQWSQWQHLFDNRAASRDIGLFQIAIDATALVSHTSRDEQIREVLRAGFGDRRYVYAVEERDAGELNATGVVVLRDRSGERLTGDRKSAEIAQQRYNESEMGQDVEARFRFRGYGNGVEWGAARVRELVASGNGEVRDDRGRLIDGAELAGDLVQKGWRKELHSRRGRDVMHVIVSARAGTDAPAFEAAVREFLADQFAGHRYVFAVHDPALDPKDREQGGKRLHIHAHAIVTMRSQIGTRVETSPRVFREWRSLLAEKAREQGIDMEFTDRRELASAPAYTRNQVRPLDYGGRTEHEGTSESAHARYLAKRANELNLAGSDRSRQCAAKAAQVWIAIANERPGTPEGAFAALQKERLKIAARRNQIDIVNWENKRISVKNNTNIISPQEVIEGEVDQMREMTRPEFEAYEKRVEAALASVERTLDPSDRAEFDEVAAAAREVVDIRREYLELTEQQTGLQRKDITYDDRSERSPETESDVQEVRETRTLAIEPGPEAQDEGTDRSQMPRDAMLASEADEAIAALRNTHSATAKQSGDGQDVDRFERDEAIDRATKLALEGNHHIRLYAEQDQDLKEAIAEAITERARSEALEALDEVENSRHNIRLMGDPRYAARFSSAMENYYPGEDVDLDAERKQLNVALETAGKLGISGNQFILEAAERDPELRQTMERLKTELGRDENESDVARPSDLPEQMPRPGEPNRADPPQQHVPRLRQIEREIKHRHERERDEHEQ